MVSKKTTIISISSNKELHGKGCQPNSHGLEFIDHNSPIFISRYCLFTIPTSSLKIADSLLFCCYLITLFLRKSIKFLVFFYTFFYTYLIKSAQRALAARPFYPNNRILNKAKIAGPPWVKIIFLLAVIAP